MFCPKCGKDEQSAEAYCRNCGVWLPDLSKPQKSSFGGDTPVDNVNNTITFNIISAIFAAFVIFAVYSVFFGLGTPIIGTYYAVLMALAGAFATCILAWQITSVFISLRLRRRISRRKITFQQSNELNQSPAQNVLPAADTSQIVRPMSVTENTTALLEPIPAKQMNKLIK